MRRQWGFQWAWHGMAWLPLAVGPTCRVKVAEPRSLLTKYNLSELIHLIHAIPGNGPNRAGLDLGSTRARGKDDGSSYKLPQIILYSCVLVCTHIWRWEMTDPPFPYVFSGGYAAQTSICIFWVKLPL